MDLDAVRTFVAAADAGRFQDAAVDLSVTQQAVSKRVAALEGRLGVRLFTRTPRGVVPTAAGRAFLPRARDLLRAADLAVASVRTDRRPLRVDVVGRHLAPAALLRDFHRTHPEVELDVVTHFRDAGAALSGLRAGAVDASFRALLPAAPLPAGLTSVRVLDEPLQLVTGPAHVFADAGSVALADLARHRIRMPALAGGGEWTAYYGDLAAGFGLTLEATGPNFGVGPLLDVVAGSPATATLVGERTRLAWPAHHDLRRVDLRDPTPVYPHSLVWRRDDPHPGLAALRDHVGRPGPRAGGGPTWSPAG
ncbi:LysR family transcriptional regulator [Saccharothrix longispora]|uniref:DNA-binding transcriptional LysR family regulator n=1 Tax=Saccharothrix longispora TaxID=33920 RepID=A0ABU1Q6F6_9PSEU|nr:LysR family transcriptional regulator [Saccharothrix longispora]MDR6598466.1 DNA-binding transcriptional LysR family regulator [Saccharothrix longispora]